MSVVISKKGLYALRAMVCLAKAQDGDDPKLPHPLLSIRDISEKEKIPRIFLEQILLQLKKKGLLYSYRGHKGGFGLARPAEEIFVQDILECSGDIIDLVHKGKNRQCQQVCHQNCSMCSVLHYVSDNIKNYFSHLNLSKLTKGEMII